MQVARDDNYQAIVEYNDDGDVKRVFLVKGEVERMQLIKLIGEWDSFVPLVGQPEALVIL